MAQNKVTERKTAERKTAEPVQTLAVWYLQNSGGNHKTYLTGLAHGYRIGQAFFIALSEEDQAKLRGTSYDPFYGGQVETYEALDFLTQKGFRIVTE